MDDNESPIQGDRILCAAEASRKLGLCRTSFYALLKEKGFPRLIALSAHAHGYSERERNVWLANRPRA